ncbi:MAG: DNA adenine methylase [Bacteroidales bacterium]|nr:DNA adenine methylase [Bacteroidales bacterium]
MKQRSDYTFKYNIKNGRHGWLRLTPAYSIKLVKEILSSDTLFATECQARNILDPFCGTATTGVVAAEYGLNCTLYDINPFLVWFCKIKAKNFQDTSLEMLVKKVESDIKSLQKLDKNYWLPPMKNIERWWSEDTLASLSTIHNYITTQWGCPNYNDDYNLLWIAFARLCIETSAADFNHISVSFKDNTTIHEWKSVTDMFLAILMPMIQSAKTNLTGNVTIHEGDSRLLQYDGLYDTVITSPPYPNRISYIRELRPYMYWLGFLESGEEAGELDWKAIGGTWGCATSRLNTWMQKNSHLPQMLLDTCNAIESSDTKNGKTMAAYVRKFFDDMYIHFGNLRNHLKPNASINYILGNSSFYGHFVDTDLIVEEMLRELNFSNISSTIIRKRNSKNNLYEYLIRASYN